MVRSSLIAVRASLPRSSSLDDEGFRRRHQIARAVLAAHVPALLAWGALQGASPALTGGEAAGVAALGWAAGMWRHRRVVSVLVAAGMAAASASIVHLADGMPEARVHVLLALGVVALYQDWAPYLAAVAVGIAGQVLAAGDGAPAAAGVILAAAAIQLVLWRAAEEEHRKATRLAGELARAQSQIEARESVSELFVNLARRNQALLDRQIDLIVGMEERETEPEQLAQLFQLDHLATRIRRNAESLLVLSGEEPARRWGRPVPLTDVVRAAVAEVEDYRRVDVQVDETVAVAGRAVADLAHLIAELVENGLQFSPPESRVRVTSATKPDRSCVLAVEDRGIGLSEVDLSSANDLLARPPEVDLRLSKRLGFHVVSRLAARYRFVVRLAPTPGTGTTATVAIPEELLAPAEVPTSVVAPPAPVRAAPARPTPAPAPTVAGRALTPPAALPTLRVRPNPTGSPAGTGSPEAPQRAPQLPVAAPAEPVVAARLVAPPVLSRPTPPPVPQVPAASGLPRRVPQASLNPRLLAATSTSAARPAAAAASAVATPAGRRTPEEVRSMLSSFQAGQQRGRAEAGAEGEVSS